MMQNRKTAIFFGALTLFLFGWWIVAGKQETKQPESNYYTGVMYNFRTGKYVDGAGHVVPAPPGSLKKSTDGMPPMRNFSSE